MAAGWLQDACWLPAGCLQRWRGCLRDAQASRGCLRDACRGCLRAACGMPACLHACMPAGMLQAFCRACLRVAQAFSSRHAFCWPRQAKWTECMNACHNRSSWTPCNAFYSAGIQAFSPFCWPGLAKRMPAGPCLRNPQACLQASRSAPFDACASRRHAAAIPWAG